MRSRQACLRLFSRGIALLALAGLAIASPTAVQAGSLLERVTFAEREDGHGYAVWFHADAPIQAYREPQILEGGVIEIVLLDVTLAPGFNIELPHDPVLDIDVIPKDGDIVFRLQLQDALPLAVSAHRAAGSMALLLGVTYLGSTLAPTPSHDVPAQVVPEKGPSTRARQRWKLDTVVIDAGHGGKDFGASAHGVREKDVTLAVALRLGRYVEEQLGCKVVYTRDNDSFVELRERGHIANDSGAKLFVSIHANAASSGAAKGTETYFLGMHKSEAARHVMDRENSVVAYESDPDQYKEFDESGLIMHALAQSAYMRKSEELAGLVEEHLHTHTGNTSRGVKQAGFYVLWSASMPSVLVELGFITNRSEAAFMASERGQDYLASAIFRAIRDFKEQYEREIDLAEVR